jgi:hypothetical protein
MPAIDYRAIIEAASAAASAASAKYITDHGASPVNCGFAWVEVRPCRGPFITAMKKLSAEANGKRHSLFGGRSDYHKCWMFWGPGDYNGQDMSAKHAGAQAFANVLVDKLNLSGVTVSTRLD